MESHSKICAVAIRKPFLQGISFKHPKAILVFHRSWSSGRGRSRRPATNPGARPRPRPAGPSGAIAPALAFRGPLYRSFRGTASHSPIPAVTPPSCATSARPSQGVGGTRGRKAQATRLEPSAIRMDAKRCKKTQKGASN